LVIVLAATVIYAGFADSTGAPRFFADDDPGVGRVELMAMNAVGLISSRILPVTYGIILIGGTGVIPQIRQPIIRRIIVPVADVHSGRTWTHERLKHDLTYPPHGSGLGAIAETH
jgi:hypothetical protein